MLTIAENFAASQVLTEWPDNFNYDDLLSGIDKGNVDIIIYEAYESMLPYEIIEIIECLRVCFLCNVKAITEELRRAIRIGSPSIIAEELASLESKLGE